MAVDVARPNSGVPPRSMHIALWIVQALLAALFVFAGVMKLVTPAEEIAKQMPFSVGFMRFIGIVELLGGLGVILPTLTGIAPVLTPVAAVGLVLVMIGAVVTTLTAGMGAAALLPLVVGVLAGFVAYGRFRTR